MDDWIVGMLNSLGSAGAGSTTDLLLSPSDYNHSLWNASLTIANTAVKPITAVVLSIMAVLMLANTSTHVEGDRELGVRAIAGSMFKIVLVIIVAQNAVLLLDGINAIATSVAGTANSLDVGTAVTAGAQLGDQLRAKISDAGMVQQLGMLVVLLIPFLAAKIVGVLATVLIFVRFLQLYMLTAFASLPLAFFGHDDTKPIAIGYLKRYATTALQGVMLIIALKLYQALLGGWLGSHVNYDNSDMWSFIIAHFGEFFIGPLVLAFLLIGASSLAKAVIGEG